MIAYLAASLFELDVFSVDIDKPYMNAPCRGRIWCETGPEFGIELQRKVLIMESALYALKSSAASWRNLLVRTMSDLNFKSCFANPDIYRLTNKAQWNKVL